MNINIEIMEETHETEKMNLCDYGMLAITFAILLGLLTSFSNHYLGFDGQYILTGLTALCGCVTLLINHINTL